MEEGEDFGVGAVGFPGDEVVWGAGACGKDELVVGEGLGFGGGEGDGYGFGGEVGGGDGADDELVVVFGVAV